MTDQTYTELFRRCIEVILRHEGGYVNHPSDPGGETNMGIAKKFYPELDIKNLTRDQAVAIYFRDYWTPMNLQEIYNENLVLQIFDMGVNAGIRRAIAIMQRIVGVAADGIIGPITEAAINVSEDNLVELYKQERRKYYRALARRKPELEVFLRGWLNRVDDCKLPQV